jgi:DNA-binding transcriptional ArsR family regulator
LQFFIHCKGLGVVPVPLYEAKAELFRTLGHPVRIRVLELLSERDHAVHELLAEIDIEPSALSQQLAVLRRTGLVRQQRIGGAVVYSLLVDDARQLLLAARRLLRQLASAQDDLVRQLGELTDATDATVATDATEHEGSADSRGPEEPHSEARP